MNLQEHIKKVLREEKNLIPMIRRRIPHDDLEREFKESLDMSSNMLVNLNRNDGGIISLKRFIDITTSILMDGIHYEIYSTMPLESQWYDEVIGSLKKHYKHRIEVRYDQLMRKVLKEEYEIPINVRRRLHTLRDTLKNSLRSSYPCDYDGLDEFIEGNIRDVNEYFRWVEKEKEMTSEQAELTIRAYLLDDIKEYYLKETQNC
jgi:hypothetical protein